MDAERPDVEALAERLAGLPQMISVPSPASLRAHLEALHGALGPGLENYGTVTGRDAPQPAPLGEATPRGFVACVFTSHERAEAYARRVLGLARDEAVATFTQNWSAGLARCLARGDAGVRIDDGGEDALQLDRAGLARLYAKLTRADFARLARLHVLQAGEGPHVQAGADGTRQVFAFDSEAAGRAGLSRLASAGSAPLGLADVAAYKFLRSALDAGVGRVVVNHGLADEHSYDRADVEHILALVEAAARSRPAPLAASEAEPSPAVRRALAPPRRPPLAAPVRADADNRALFAAWRERLGQGTAAPWQFLEAFAFELAVHVPVHGQPVEGLAWPQTPQDPRHPGQLMCPTFTSAEAIRGALASVHPDYRRFATLAGVEALRWIWSAPQRVDSVAVDYAQPGGLQFPSSWIAGLLFPAAAEVDDLRRVPAAPPSQLGRLPGARALKPPILRTLALGWRQLLALAQPHPVTRDGRRYLPLFTDQEQLFAFMSAAPGERLKPEPVASEPPWLHWLAGASGYHGLLLDPAGVAPLALDPTDLLLLDLWARHPNARPQPGEIVEQTARLVELGLLGEGAAACIVADLPVYWYAARRLPEGGYDVVTHNDDMYALFSSEERARAYLESASNLAQGGFQPGAAVSRWGGQSVFDHALRAFRAACIDPDRPGSSAGLRLGEDALQAALARLDERLRPRLAGFVWGEAGLQP